MASFVPYYKKKQLQLREKEGELLALLQKGADNDAVTRAAEEVQLARVRALKAQIAKLPPSEKNAKSIEQLQEEIVIIGAAPVESILDDFRQKAAHLKTLVSIPRAPRRGS